MKHLKTLLLTVLIAAMTLGLSLGIAACDSDKLVNYSVTVTCDDAEVLGGIKVQLKGEKGSSEEKTPVNGTASFELEAGTYTVNLTNVPTGYSYQEKTLTESAPSATVALVKAASETVTYTVTVTCDDAEVLNSVTVKLQKGSESVAEKKLDNGKAVFDLAPGAYTVVLTGVPAGYTFESKALSSTVTETTVALTKNVTAIAADVTVKTAAGEDVFGNEQPETALKYVTLALYASEEDQAPQATATTDENGVAHFDAVTPGSYLVSVNGVESGTLAIGGPTAMLELHTKLGSKAAPLAWKVGENEVPLTQEILEELGDEFVYYTLLVAESGLYSFDADQDSVNVSGDVLGTAWTGPTRHITAQLEADVVYTFACSSIGAAEGGSFGYKVTVTKGNTSTGGGDTPDIPWTTGSGTKEAPYISTSLKGTYRVPVKFENGKYVPVYFQYTETAAEKYAIYSSSQNFYLTVWDKNAVDSDASSERSLHYVGGGDASSKQSLFQTEANKTYLFELTPYDDDGSSDVTVPFTIGDYTGYFPKWEGSGVFQTAAGYEKDDPFIVTTLVDDYEAHGANRVYFKYEATETKNYTVTLISEEEDTLSIDFWLRNYNGGKPDAGKHYSLTKTENSAVISLTAGTTYLFGVSGEDSDMEVHVKIMKFKITEGGTPSTGGPDAPDDGSKSKPFQIADILAENTLQVTANGYYYTFRVTEDGTYTFTAKTALLIKDFQGSNGQTLASFQGNKVGATKDYELFANVDYTFNLMGFGPDAGSEVTLKVEFKAEAPAVTLPEEFNGNWQGVNSDYSLSITGGKLTLKKSGAAVETVVTSKASTTMAGKTSYFVTFEGKTYTLQWNSAGDKMLQLYLNSATALYFAPNPLPAFTFEESLCGEYVDREGKLPDHIVVSANGISWANHTIVLVSDMSGSDYPGYDKAIAAYVDGKPDLILFTNDSILFRQANVWFDNVEEGTITLPAEYIGKWKSADGKYTLETTATTVTLKENDSPVTATLRSEKKGGDTVYYLAFHEAEYELTAFLPGALSLIGETSIHFAKDPLPKVDLSKIVGVYRSSDILGYIVITKDKIEWGSHKVVAVAEPSVSSNGETGYPLFVDDLLYVLVVSSEGHLLRDLRDGTDFELTNIGTEVPEADGSQSKPFILENFLGDQSMPGMTSTQKYYVFELPFPATLTFTAKTSGFAVYINNTSWVVSSTSSKKEVKNLSGVVTLRILSMGGTVDASFTISLNYTVTVKSTDKDVYGNLLNEKGKSGVAVTFMKGTQTVKTENTNASGVATFLVTELGEYTAKVDDKSYSFTNAACEVKLVSDVVYGSSAEYPLSLSLGANEFDLSEEVMEQYGSGICYVFACTYSGTYTFTISEAGAMFMLMDGEDGKLSLGDVGGLTAKATLEKGKTYTAMLAGGAPVTLTIALDLGDVEGAGTLESPEVLRTLDSVFRYVGIDANAARYFRFVLDKNYAITIKASKNCTIGGALVGTNQNLNATGSLTVVVKKNTPVDFFVFLQKNVGKGYLELTFEGTETPDVPFGGSGTQTDPYKPDDLAGEYELYVSQNKYVFFEYTVTKDTTYKVTFIEGVSIDFYLPTGTTFAGTGKNSLSSSKAPDTFTVTAGTKLTFRIWANATGVVKFKIEEVVS